jgi:hypothetical protein
MRWATARPAPSPADKLPQRFPDFWPEGNRFYGPLKGIEPGEVALLNMTLPGIFLPGSGTSRSAASARAPERGVGGGWG